MSIEAEITQHQRLPRETLKLMNIAAARIRTQVAYELLSDIVERAEPGPPSPLVDTVARANQILEAIPRLRLQAKDVTPTVMAGRIHACRKILQTTKHLASLADGEALSRWIDAAMVLLQATTEIRKIMKIKIDDTDYRIRLRHLESTVQMDLRELI